MVLKTLFGEEKYERFNFLPVHKFILPVNKENAVKSKTIKASDLPLVADEIVINYRSRTMFKNNLLLLDILANNDWKRPINFSNGGIYDDENIFYLNDYLQFDGFNYRLVPIKTSEQETGDMGRVDADEIYKVVKDFRWGNFKDLNVHYDETATSNIIGYRMAASRAADALVEKGEKQKAIEILDLASKEIPVAKYNDPRSLSTIVYGYIIAGQEQKGLKLAEELKKGIFEEYDYYASLTKQEQRFVARQMRTKPMEYSMVVGAVSDAYNKLGQKEKGYDYLVSSIGTIDKRFDSFIKDLKAMGKEKAFEASEGVKVITPFYQYLFEIMKPYDSTYGEEKMSQITNAVVNATK